MYDFNSMINTSYEKDENSIWAYPQLKEQISVPCRGFKIHVSAIPNNAAYILKNVEKILIEEHAVYKVISSVENMMKLNAGEFGYSQIGKSITVYPRNDVEFCRLIEEMYIATLGFQAVDIPSDYRYKNSFVVFYRYGEFQPSDFQDKRQKKIPANIKVPLDDYYIARYSEIPKRYMPIKCLRSRGKALVYFGVDQIMRSPIIIKEGKMLGESNRLGDGANSIINEKNILCTLKGCSAFPEVYDHFFSSTSFVVIEEFKQGRSLKDILLGENADSIKEHKYTIMQQIVNTIRNVFLKGIVIGDLSLDNLIFDEKKQKLYFLDAEYYVFGFNRRCVYSWTVGFFNKKYEGWKAVVYATLVIWYYLTFPHKYREEIFENKGGTQDEVRLIRVCEQYKDILNASEYEVALRMIEKVIQKEVTS